MTIDLRSDTVTRPTAPMRVAMAAAEVGDDVFGDDPTVNALQKRIADLLGKEAALFVPTGTQSNLCALMSHCGRGDDFKSQVLFHGQRIGTLRFSSQVRQQAAEVNTMAAPCQSPGKSKTFYGFRLA